MTEQDLHKWLLACPTGDYEVDYEDEDFIHLHIPQPKEGVNYA